MNDEKLEDLYFRIRSIENNKKELIKYYSITEKDLITENIKKIMCKLFNLNNKERKEILKSIKKEYSKKEYDNIIYTIEKLNVDTYYEYIKTMLKIKKMELELKNREEEIKNEI